MDLLARLAEKLQYSAQYAKRHISSGVPLGQKDRNIGSGGTESRGGQRKRCSVCLPRNIESRRSKSDCSNCRFEAQSRSAVGFWADRQLHTWVNRNTERENFKSL